MNHLGWLACIVGAMGAVVGAMVVWWLLRIRVWSIRAPPMVAWIRDWLFELFDFFNCGESPPDNYLIGLQKMALKRFKQEAKLHGIVGVKRTRLYCCYRASGCSQFEALMRVD